MNACACGLIALAGYKLSKGVADSKLTLAILFLSTAISLCYESSWLYPVLIASGGLLTVSTYLLTEYLQQRRLKKEAIANPPTQTQSETVQAPVHDIEPEDSVNTRPGDDIELQPVETLRQRRTEAPLVYLQ